MRKWYIPRLYVISVYFLGSISISAQHKVDSIFSKKIFFSFEAFPVSYRQMDAIFCVFGLYMHSKNTIRTLLGHTHTDLQGPHPTSHSSRLRCPSQVLSPDSDRSRDSESNACICEVFPDKKSSKIFSMRADPRSFGDLPRSYDLTDAVFWLLSRV